MSVEFTSILTTFIVIFILLMAPCLAGDSSRDLLLTIRNKAAPLDHRVRQLVSRLGLPLCRRGCKRTRQRQRSALINCISATHTGSQRLSVCISKDALSLIVLNAHSLVKLTYCVPAFYSRRDGKRVVAAATG